MAILLVETFKTFFFGGGGATYTFVKPEQQFGYVNITSFIDHKINFKRKE